MQSSLFLAELDEYLRGLDIRPAEAVSYAKKQIGSELQNVADYAASIRAVTPKAGGVEITPIGRVFLDLVGRDAVRWLLQVEVAHSGGPKDPVRLSREMAQDLLMERLFLDHGDGECPVPDGIAHRLVDMGLLKRNDERRYDFIDRSEDDEWLPGIFQSQEDHTGTLYTVTRFGTAMLAELQQEDSPLAVLADTLCADMSISAARGAIGRGTLGTLGTGFAAEATARTARLVVHEIRNTLLPVRSALDSLYREVLAGSSVDVLKKRRPLIDQGITRIFEFADQLKRTAALAATSSEPFEPIPAIRDAAAAVDAPASVRLDLMIPSSPLPPLRGNRDRFVLALVNLLRNAFQHGGEKLTTVRLQVESGDQSRAVRIVVDDDGQGVPEDRREEIFTEGVSLSPGGIGLGLTLAREVLEREFQGAVVCEQSPLGGARFQVRIPAAGASS